MKTSVINNSGINRNNNIAFKGHKLYSNDIGGVRHKFFLPYDEKNFTATIEFRQFKEQNGEWLPVEDTGIISKIMPARGLALKTNSLFPKQGIITGYRYVLTSKNNPSNKIYQIDSGVIANVGSNNADEHFTLLFPNRNILPENGLTKQVMPDICFPGYYLDNGNLKFSVTERNRALNAVRNHGNKLGGQFAGIIRMLPLWQKEGYTKIVGTPFTKDEVSSHLYWTENPLQVSSNLGDLNDFKNLQIELFKNGINFIADGAFVNQGLQGVLFRNVLRHGENSPFFHWFKASGLLSGDLKIGAIPAKEKARENFRFRLVNTPINIIEENGKIEFVKNKKYDSSKTSYIQLYDKRLISKKQLENTSDLFKRYEKTNTDNPYEITNHDDVTQLVSFEVNPYEIKNRIKKVLSNIGKSKLSFDNSNFVENFLTFPYFRITTKDKGGVDLWDGNMDIAKLNFYVGNTDQALLNRYEYDASDKKAEIERMKKAIYQVQDYTLQAGKYWTKLVSDTQFLYIANVLKGVKPTAKDYKKKIESEIENGNLPQKLKGVITESFIEKVLGKHYISERTKQIPKDIEDRAFVRELVMDFPLDSVEFAPDLTGVLASPYVSKRATNEKEFFISRRDNFCNNTMLDPTKRQYSEYSSAYDKADYALADEITEFVLNTLLMIDGRLDFSSYNVPKSDYKKLFKIIKIKKDDETSYIRRVTEYGKYIIPVLVPEIMKYIMVKGLKPSTPIECDKKTGVIDYKNSHTEDISLQTFGISGSPESEAKQIIARLKEGVQSYMDGDNEEERSYLEGALAQRLYSVTLHQLKMAEAIMDKTGTGLGWRIDAAKDIGNIDALRTGNDNDEQLFSQVTEFWKKFNDAIKTQNKHAYTTAEITDLEHIMSTKNGEFKNSVNAETKFIERSGLNNTANYMFFYSMPKEIFAKSAEDGRLVDYDNAVAIHDKLIKGWSDDGEQKCHGFLYQYPGDSIINSYTFVGNHDKPRSLHVFALDMELFHSDLSGKAHRDKALNVLQLNSYDDINPETISAKAIAMGDRLIEAFKATGIINTKDKDNNEQQKAIRDAIAELAGGYYKKEKFDADAFGTRDFRYAIKDVLDVAEYKLNRKIDNRDEYFNKVLENILAPAMDKMESVYKMLVTLPGSPTDFVGDKEGATGYETKSNNDYQQNRNVVPFEWINATLQDKYLNPQDEKPFVNDYYIRMTKIGNLRNKKELSALKNGETVALPVQHGTAFKDGNIVNPNVKVSATFRYDDKGSQVICLYTTDGATANNTKKMDRNIVNLDKVVLGNTSENWKEGVKGGLKEGDMFKNANNDAVYKVSIENGEYVLKRTNSVYKAVSIMPEDKNTAVLYKINPEEYNPIPATLYFKGMN